MLQLATPYANDEDTEGSLDAWVWRIKERYPKKAEWLAQGADGKSKRKKQEENAAETVGPKAPDVSKYDIPSLKKQLIESGMPEDMLELFSDADIVENARSMGLLEEAKQESQ
jgi:hypothetical protein